MQAREWVNWAAGLAFPVAILWEMRAVFKDVRLHRVRLRQLRKLKPQSVEELLSGKGSGSSWVEVLDVPRGETCYESPVTLTPCVWWRFQVRALRRSGGKENFVYEVSLASVESPNQLVVLGKSSHFITVDLRNAEIVPEQGFFWSSLGKLELPEKLRLCLEAHSDPEFRQNFQGQLADTLSLRAGMLEIRYVEEFIPLGQPLYAFGHLKRSDQGAKIGGHNCIVSCDGEAAVEKFLMTRKKALHVLARWSFLAGAGVLVGLLAYHLGWAQ